MTTLIVIKSKHWLLPEKSCHRLSQGVFEQLGKNAKQFEKQFAALIPG